MMPSCRSGRSRGGSDRMEETGAGLEAPSRGLPHHRVSGPRHACDFFEALVIDNPAAASHTTSRSTSAAGPPRHLGTFRTATGRRDNGGVIVNVFYKDSRIKQCLYGYALSPPG